MTVNDDDVLRCTARMQSHGTDDIINVFHVQHVSGTTKDDADLESEIAAWLDAIYTCLNTHIVNSIQYIDILIYNVTQDVPLVTQAWPTLTFGTLAADDLPHGVAALISMETGVKKVTGRKYFGGFPTTDIGDGGTWVVAVATLMACVLVKMVGWQGGTSADIMPGVWSTGAQLFRPFTQAAFDYVPAYQRRRRPGHGS